MRKKRSLETDLEGLDNPFAIEKTPEENESGYLPSVHSNRFYSFSPEELFDMESKDYTGPAIVKHYKKGTPAFDEFRKQQEKVKAEANTKDPFKNRPLGFTPTNG